MSFLGTHALPLSVIGLGLGWLALSIRSQSRVRDQASLPPPRHVPTLRGAYREPLTYSEEPRDQRSDGTSATPKLLGVRTLDAPSL
ncbi:MAG TPA: hypothetical protein VFX59_02100 [Polyangiales bacterium]|nr:hypothetical protein [Polyangiales bacterium]